MRASSSSTSNAAADRSKMAHVERPEAATATETPHPNAMRTLAHIVDFWCCPRWATSQEQP
jgi:hypothetical protein